jgi:Ca2+-binding EF-hand superfamily protein
MKKVMDSVGFTSGKQEVTYQDFYQFFKCVYPEITNEDTDYLFKKTDTDNSGSISVD